jgi:alkanesulfonate monooxygenase SsuD/methylene tetrahydromethanopterin reductase-like flavin-dependent oxidoreductase (luciferase family)
MRPAPTCSAMRRSIVFSTSAFAPLLDVARAAESAGFHRVWTTETSTRDAVVRAVAIAAATTRIQVGTGIAYAFTRAPLATATMAADAHAASGGRFALGLGTGTRGMRTRRYGVDFDQPGPRFAEYVELVRAAWAARGELAFEGRYYTAAVPEFALERDAVAGLELYGAAVNPRMLSAVLAACDGVLLHAVTAVPRYLDGTVVPLLRRAPGARVALWCVTSIDDDAEAARMRAKATLAFYFTTPSYAGVVEGTPWEAPVRRIREAFRAGDVGAPHELATLVPDDLADALTLSGTSSDVADRLPAFEAALAERGIDEIVFQTVGVGLPQDVAVANCHAIVATCAPRGAALPARQGL